MILLHFVQEDTRSCYVSKACVDFLERNHSLFTYCIMGIQMEGGKTDSSQPFLVKLKIPQKMTEEKHF